MGDAEGHIGPSERTLVKTRSCVRREPMRRAAVWHAKSPVRDRVASYDCLGTIMEGSYSGHGNV